MSQENKDTLYQLQKAEKPKIETVIEATLSGERRKAAADFVLYVRSLRMTPQWASANSWAVSYKK